MNATLRLPSLFQPTTIVPVLMAGGSGTRLWPLSREQYPKQFLPLLGARSLLQDTALRASAIEHATPPVIIGADMHRFIIAEQLQQAGIHGAAILLEPEGRNTAPAAAVAAHYVSEEYGPDALVFLMAADQALSNIDAFLAAVKTAAVAAVEGSIITFGIKPTSPETGFGYLKAGARLGTAGIYEVDAFVEKPSLERAREFVKSGDHYWNGGMFMFRSGRMLAELNRLEPTIYEKSLESLQNAEHSRDYIALEAKAFRACRNESIDYAVMERTTNIALVSLDAGWDDVGSWTFLDKQNASDNEGNRLRGDVLVEDGHHNLVHASSRLVALIGVDNQVVVETDDAVLVTTRDRAQDVKKIVQRLKSARRIEAQTCPRVYRPWGYYETIALGERFQVKRISVKPGHQLSLQMHHHRAEHWVVVCGTAKVTCGEKVFLLSEDQSTYIPLGNTHRLENPGKLPLELIEVQSGAYLEEDDIVRFSDLYGRSEPAAGVAKSTSA